MRKLAYLAFPLLLVACHQEENCEGHSAYFPPEDIFEKGFAVKYYSHFEPSNENEESQIRISYASYQKSDNTHFSIHNYNAGFEPTGSKYYRIQGDNLFLDSSFYYLNGDTLEADIIAAHSKSWQNDQHPL